MLKLIGKLGNKHITVVGDLILDKYLWGSVSRISPEAPIQILKTEKEEFRAGGASNVAANLASLGSKVFVGGFVGKDQYGMTLKSILRKSGIDVSCVLVHPTKPTSIKTRMIAHNQQVLRVDTESVSPIETSLGKNLMAKIVRIDSDLIILQDYQKGTLVKELCRGIIKSASCPVFVGLKTHEFTKYKGATCVSLNKGELLGIARENSVQGAADKLIEEMGLQFIIVTLGEQGIMVRTKDSRTIHHTSEAREVYDVTGAGDTVLAAFALAYASGMDLSECAKLANSAAGIVVGKLGTAVVSRSELYDICGTKKVISVKELKKIIASRKAGGQKIVFTNGVFDILHDGHINLLSFARGLGDILIVGMNSDSSTRVIKGDKRPILSQEKRLTLLSAIQFCDYVVIFDEETPEKLIQGLRPDIIVKGEDWKGKKVVGSDHAKVVFAPFVRGSSTTEIINKVVNLYRK